MALFAKKNNKTVGVKKEGKAITPKLSRGKSKEDDVILPSSDLIGVLINPRITEKATMLSETRNVYTFNVSPEATKKDIERVIKSLYKVNPSRIRIVQIKSKRTFVRGKRGVKSGGKKAYIYLKQGDKIEIA